MADDTQACPKCGEDCDRDSADVGVGIIYGPWGCPACGWSSDPHYDRSGGESPGQREMPSHYVDQFGGATPKRAIKKGLARFGLDPSVVDDVFGPEWPDQDAEADRPA